MRRKRSTTALGRFALVPGTGGGGGPSLPVDPDQSTYQVLVDELDQTMVDDEDATLTADSWL